MLLTMFPMGSGTTASTSTEREHIDIEPCSSGPVSGRTETSRQRCKKASLTLEDTARAYPDLDLTQALHIEPRTTSGSKRLDRSNRRSARVSYPTGSGKTFLGLQAIADAGVSTLVVTPTIDLMNQWHATLTNAFGDQLTEPVGGVLGGGSHDVTAITVTTYDSAYRYVNEYGDQFGLLVVDEEHHLPAPTYRQIPR